MEELKLEYYFKQMKEFRDKEIFENCTYIWEPLNKNYTELLSDMINQGIKDYKRRISKIHSFETNILEGYHGGAKGLKGTKGLKGKLK